MVFRLHLFARLLVLPLIALLSTRANASDTLPYLYYYSTEQRAFITEKVDGTDSQILTRFDIADDRMIVGPGWSPSGSWFAWTVGRVDGGSIPESVAMLVNRDGDLIDLFPDMNTKGAVAHVEMLWSPKTELLLVNYRYAVYDNGNQTEYKNELFVYDPTIQTRLINLPQGGIFHEWSPDGQYIVSYSDHSSTSQFTLLPIASSNVSISRAFHLAPDCPDASLPTWSPDSKIMYVTDEQLLIVEDFAHDQAYSFALPSGIVRLIDWSPDGQSALVYTAEKCETKRSVLWLVDLQTQRMLGLSQSAHFQIPTQHQAARYSSFTQEYVPHPSTAWNKTSQYAWAVSVQNTPYLIQKLPVSAEEIVGIADVNPARVDWSGSNPLQLMFVDHETLMAYVVGEHLVNNVLTENRLSSAEISYFSMSPNGRYLGYLNHDAFYVEALNGETAVSFNLIGSNQGAVSNTDLSWHPNQDWLFAMGVTTSKLTRLIDVVNATGSVHRQIGGCSLTPSCFGWLPNVTP